MRSASPSPHQPSFAELGTPLHAVTFVVVDLETTGGSCHDCRITEFGAVKIHGGEIVGEFQSLVDPGQPIPRAISALTGITDAMVSTRPPVEAVLPTFLEFCRGAALVAHNAGFDISFLNAGLARLDYPALDNRVVCTAQLARRLVRDEVRNCKLSTLAHYFSCRTQPTHRALADARATVEVFHGLLERAGSFGVVTLEDLIGFSKAANAPLFASRRKLADGLPNLPGVYAFKSASGEILYVGKATDLRSRVRSYFGNDERRKIAAMMKETSAVDHRVCATAVEAAVREVRLIHRHRPRFNQRSKNPQRQVYVRLTRERFPRLSVVKAPPVDGSPWLGPFSSRSAAERVVEAVQDVVPIRRCTPRIGASTRFAPCALGPMGRCLSPCDGSVTPDVYARSVAAVAQAFAGDPGPIVATLLRRMARLAAARRYEEAAVTRERLHALVSAISAALHRCAVLAAGRIIASRTVSGGAEVVIIRDGTLVTSVTVGTHEVPAVVAEFARTLRAGELTLPPATAGSTGPDNAEETALLSRWLQGAGVVLHHVEGSLAYPVGGGRVLQEVTARLRRSHRSAGRPELELAAKRRRRPGAATIGTTTG